MSSNDEYIAGLNIVLEADDDSCTTSTTRSKNNSIPEPCLTQGTIDASEILLLFARQPNDPIQSKTMNNTSHAESSTQHLQPAKKNPYSKRVSFESESASMSKGDPNDPSYWVSVAREVKSGVNGISWSAEEKSMQSDASSNTPKYVLLCSCECNEQRRRRHLPLEMVS
jgi:hypothetical protein